MTPHPDAVVGCLLGQAVGDMMGLPAENLSRRRVGRLFPRLDRPGFFFGYGVGSDDTEHACLTAQALLRSGGDVARFRRSLAWELRWWFLAGPPGIGLATLKACVKLWVGFPPTRSGVYSAGNGPAMRAAILGACAWNERSVELVGASTLLTHTDPLASGGATVIFSLAFWAARRLPLDGPGWLRQAADTYAGDPRQGKLAGPLREAAAALEAGRSVGEFAESLGLARGVSGYIAHTVPVAVFAFFRHPDDYRAAVQAVIRCGGDTDTVAAITGALVGARVGKAGIPAEWLERWIDWPRSVRHVEALGRELVEGAWRTAPRPGVPLAWWAIPVRNLLFFAVVLGHLARRLLPPY